MTVRERLDAYLQRNGLEAIWFARPNSFAWLTGGDNVVSRSSDVGIAAAGYDGDDVVVVTDSIEGPRLAAEELDQDVKLVTFPWYDTDLAEVLPRVSPQPAAADFPVDEFESIDAKPLRQPLTEDQIERYERLGADVARILETMLRDVKATDTEIDVAGRLRGGLESEGIATPVSLVGGSERAQRFRHYTPQAVELGDYALASVTAARGGLHVSCTRTIAYDAPEWLEERTRNAMRVEASALAATRRAANDGGTAGDVFAAIQDAYAAVGQEGEWEHHHQGGAAGFAGREWIGTPDNVSSVEVPMAYAWNPTIRGAKSEDTHLVTNVGVRCLSETGDWPTETVQSVDESLELERHGILER